MLMSALLGTCGLCLLAHQEKLGKMSNHVVLEWVYCVHLCNDLSCLARPAVAMFAGTGAAAVGLYLVDDAQCSGSPPATTTTAAAATAAAAAAAAIHFDGLDRAFADSSMSRSTVLAMVKAAKDEDSAEWQWR
jgi:hypothetical protein